MGEKGKTGAYVRSRKKELEKGREKRIDRERRGWVKKVYELKDHNNLRFRGGGRGTHHNGKNAHKDERGHHQVDSTQQK